MKIKVICANKDLCYALTAHLTSHGHPVIMPGAKDFSQPDVYLFDCAMIGTPAEAEVSGHEDKCIIFSCYGNIGVNVASKHGYKQYILL